MFTRRLSSTHRVKEHYTRRLATVRCPALPLDATGGGRGVGWARGRLFPIPAPTVELSCWIWDWIFWIHSCTSVWGKRHWEIPFELSYVHMYVHTCIHAYVRTSSIINSYYWSMEIPLHVLYTKLDCNWLHLVTSSYISLHLVTSGEQQVFVVTLCYMWLYHLTCGYM